MTLVTAHGLRLDIAAFSERGPRPENQDAFAVSDSPEAYLLALADGMGGEKSGRIAAETALDALHRSSPIRTIDHARRAVRNANDAITRAANAAPDTLGGMGCALGLLSFIRNDDGPGWIAAHVGDVRILSLSPDGVLRLETRDHTPAFNRWEAGEISLDEIPDTPGANRLQRAVGRGGEADVNWLPAGPGWSWLIISDGIYKALRLDELAAAMAEPTADSACEAIRAKVDERGADDNYTAVFARIVGEPGRVLAAAAGSDGRLDHETRTESTMTTSGRNGPLWIALFLAVVALGVSTFIQRTSVSRNRAEVEELQTRVDSLSAIIEALRSADSANSAGTIPLLPADTLTSPTLQ